ncbi:hypothetical protein NQ315_014263 [Exocentrus adspersus]|nr:hypothetical protein NQ315_014263 [Exocentrus adspersus]
MLNRILKIKEAVVATLALVNRDLNTLGESDWLEIKQATDVLWVFNEVTVELCAEKSVSLSKILYFIKVMRKHLSADKFSPEKLSPYCSMMVTKLHEQLNERFDRYEDNELIT